LAAASRPSTSSDGSASAKPRRWASARAYGYSLANNYNGVPRPPVIFCRTGEARVVVRRETYEDLAARDV